MMFPSVIAPSAMYPNLLRPTPTLTLPQSLQSAFSSHAMGASFLVEDLLRISRPTSYLPRSVSSASVTSRMCSPHNSGSGHSDSSYLKFGVHAILSSTPRTGECLAFSFPYFEGSFQPFLRSSYFPGTNPHPPTQPNPRGRKGARSPVFHAHLINISQLILGVKIWFQNRRMKWRNSKERELLSAGGCREQTLPTKLNPHPDLSDVGKKSPCRLHSGDEEETGCRDSPKSSICHSPEYKHMDSLDSHLRLTSHQHSDKHTYFSEEEDEDEEITVS
uniref:Developing brain homeobox 1b n=1 Tax=Callorhinchus milii TaxID=7868 RepID=A0A4W3K7E2_CALMI